MIFNLFEKFRKDTAFISNPNQIIKCESAQEIIKLKDKALPDLFSLLREGEYSTIFLIREILGEDLPEITSDIAGDMPAIADLWIKWYRKKYHEDSLRFILNNLIESRSRTTDKEAYNEYTDMIFQLKDKLNDEH